MCTQATYWPEAKRRFQPIDVEYLSCECRKYYSYVNGTKKYEGKNVFTPGKSPMLTFDATPKEASPKVRSRAIRIISKALKFYRRIAQKRSTFPWTCLLAVNMGANCELYNIFFK